MGAGKKVAQLPVAERADFAKDMLPAAARAQLSTLVTELSGVAKTLRAEINTVGDEDIYKAVSMWVDRIAYDLGAMECRAYLPTSSEPGR